MRRWYARLRPFFAVSALYDVQLFPAGEVGEDAELAALDLQEELENYSTSVVIWLDLEELT